jgi:predicted nuclease of predicted toxin-antitoxin system
VRLYLDEDIASAELRSRLVASGHEIVSTLRGRVDAEVWDYAQETGAAVVTRNARDFKPLAEASGSHSGLLVVYLENDARRDMSIVQIAEAIDQVAAAWKDGIDNHMLALNAFRLR